MNRITDERVKFICQICKGQFKHLSSHIYHRHKLLARQYKERFGLPYNMALVNDDIRLKQRQANIRHKDINRRNLVAAGKKFRFKKGQTGQRRISEYERKKYIKQILNINRRRAKKMEPCPVCRMKFICMPAHLYNKHKLINVKDIKFSMSAYYLYK